MLSTARNSPDWSRKLGWTTSRVSLFQQKSLSFCCTHAKVLRKTRQQLPIHAFLITDWKWFVVLHLPTSSGHFWMHPSTAAQPQMVHGHYTAPRSWCCSANTPERCARAEAGFYNSPVFPRLAR